MGISVIEKLYHLYRLDSGAVTNKRKNRRGQHEQFRA